MNVDADSDVLIGPSNPFDFNVTHAPPGSLCVLKRRKLSRCKATIARTPRVPQVSHDNMEATAMATTTASAPAAAETKQPEEPQATVATAAPVSECKRLVIELNEDENPRLDEAIHLAGVRRMI